MMEAISVIVAAVAAYAFGAVWYMTLAQPWMRAAGVECGPDGRPVNKSAVPFILSAIAMVVVAGAMRHVFGASVTTTGAGLTAGFGLGAFIALPWIVINYAYSGRPATLTLIDGGYAVIGCTIIGAILGWL